MQASELNIGSDVTKQCESFFEIFELIHATSIICIYSVYFMFLITLRFPKVIKSIIP